MLVLDHCFDNPQAHLDIDEALLEIVEAKGHSFLRFWESTTYFVVLGRSNDPQTEVDSMACKKDQIPILRRCSGGGTVVQGPGCLNYAVILPINRHPKLATISSTTCWIMSQTAAALQSQFDDIHIKGISDLTLGDLKFSGNAQRRKRDALLFHGTILYQFDLDKISHYLRMPSKQPDYRLERTHKNFCTNLNATSTQIKAMITAQWLHTGC